MCLSVRGAGLGHFFSLLPRSSLAFNAQAGVPGVPHQGRNTSAPVGGLNWKFVADKGGLDSYAVKVKTER